MENITLRQMLEAGAHFGHKTRYWNPKMAPYIYGKRNGIHIINLEKTLPLFNEACAFVENIGAETGTILFVGTKPAVKNEIKKAGIDCNMPYVSNRWLGGTLTNNETISKSIKKLEDLEESLKDKNTENLSKKEILTIRRAYEKLDRGLGGIREMKKLPDAIFIIDVNYERNAVQEAKTLGIPIISIVDSNSSPENIDYIIPSNDDSKSTAKLVTSTIVKSFLKGKKSVPILDDIEDDFVEVDAKGKISTKKIKRKRKVTALEKDEPENQRKEDNTQPLTTKEDTKIKLTNEPKNSSSDIQEQLLQEESQSSQLESVAIKKLSVSNPIDQEAIDQPKDTGVENDEEKP
ncbi:MAG: 30S ribosomal protein S2 [Gammaproteobacteria bacterium]|nr:30S ribosomal protein S2 [Gammaproteobacteria bacterium]|tara:strand:- start:4436 stop:5479 length:1044 start_codon:yes stop_codon:yes gene_type:complete